MKNLFERLLNKEDLIQGYVRRLKIADWGSEIDHSRPGIPSEQALANPSSLNIPWDSSELRNGESTLMGTSHLELVLENLKELESFRYG